MRKHFKKTKYLCIIILTVILDILTKSIAVTKLKESGVMNADVVKGVFSFTYHENRGAAWGMLADHRWVFMTFSTVAIVAILVYILSARTDSALLHCALSFIAGGGIGNMIDRLSLGYVVDFLNFSLIDFPIFNVADSFVTIGAALMIIYLFIPEKKETQGT